MFWYMFLFIKAASIMAVAWPCSICPGLWKVRAFPMRTSADVGDVHSQFDLKNTAHGGRGPIRTGSCKTGELMGQKCLQHQAWQYVGIAMS